MPPYVCNLLVKLARVGLVLRRRASDRRFCRSRYKITDLGRLELDAYRVDQARHRQLAPTAVDSVL